MLSEQVADCMLSLIDLSRVPVPKLPLPQILLAKLRPGLSAEILTASIVSRFNEIGIPNGPLVGGTPNVMEAFVKICCEEIVDTLQNDMRIDIAIDPGISIVAFGANAGGPVASDGASDEVASGVGIAR